MRRIFAFYLAAALLLALAGCAKPKVWVPPRMDLQKYGTLGLIEFDSSSGYGSMATKQFVASLHAAQPGIPVLELGPLHRVLDSVGHESLGPDAVRAIGERYGVDVVTTGDLGLQQPRPNFSIQSLTQANASAEIQGTLDTRFMDARSGATIWSDRADGKRTLAHLSLAGGQRPQFGAVDPDGENAKLVGWLVGRVTNDFRGYWARP